MLPGSLVGDLREPADQLFEQIAHLNVGDSIRVKVDLAESLKDLPEDFAIIQTLQLFREEELLKKDVAHVGRETADIVDQIGMELARILSAEALKGHF